MVLDWIRSMGTDRSSDAPKRLRAKDLPATQDAIEIVAAQDDVLVLRDGDVVAAVGFGSVGDALLSPAAIAARLATYRNLLKSLRFDVQLLIGTRPQNLTAYADKMQVATERIGQFQIRIDRLTTRLSGYLVSESKRDQTAFAKHFGFLPSDLTNTPDGKVGDMHAGAHSVARQLSTPAVANKLADDYAAANAEGRRVIVNQLFQRCDETSIRLQRWQEIISARTQHVELEVDLLHSPVRTYFFVVAHNPRVFVGLQPGPLSSEELERAKHTLAERCADLTQGLQQMRLPCWRATHTELLDDIRQFYHPTQIQLNPSLHAERSVSMRLASVK